MARIHEAILAVQKGVTKLFKEHVNQRQGYSFATVDEMIEMIRSSMTENGLFLDVDESDVDVIKIATSAKGQVIEVPMLKVTYEIRLMHECGESLGPAKKTIIIRADGGPLALGAAAAYAVKQYLRFRFLVPTGEPDADDIDEAKISVPETGYIDSDTVGAILKLIEETKTDIDAVCRSEGVAVLEDLTPVQAGRVLKRLRMKKKMIEAKGGGDAAH